jgi:UDP-N-acetylglucosamine 2-epimerase (non-hydrolysing)
MLRVLTILGTRPEIIRLSRLIPRLDASTDHVVVCTGQNADPGLSSIFFRELDVRAPDVVLEASPAGLSRQLGHIFAGVADVIEARRPDRVVVLGDTNSGLAALIAARAGVPVVHLEAGNRCFDWRSPEEVNRRAIDHVSAWLLPYTSRSREHLLREGIESERIVVMGNPIFEVLNHYARGIDASDVLERHAVRTGGFVLLTAHRAETVDNPRHLEHVLDATEEAAGRLGVPALFPVHPRTRDRMGPLMDRRSGGRLRLLEPLGFFDFVRLEREARLVISDSGTVQEECAILGTPCVVARDYTERPEVIECGASVLGGRTRNSLASAVTRAVSRHGTPAPPPEYLVPDASAIAERVILGALPPSFRDLE